MKRFLLIVFLFNLFLILKSQGEVDYSVCDSIDGIYIPKDLDDCILQLEKIHTDSIKQQIQEMTSTDFTTGAHMGLGMWMRNEWGLWRGSRLSLYFRNRAEERAKNEKLKYSVPPHVDNMSGAILSYYYMHLINKDLNIDIILKKCNLDTCPDFDEKLFESSLMYFDNNGIKKSAYIKYISKDHSWYDSIPEEERSVYFDNWRIYRKDKSQEALQKIAELAKMDVAEMSKILEDEYWIFDERYNWKIISGPVYRKITFAKPENRGELIKKAFDK